MPVEIELPDAGVLAGADISGKSGTRIVEFSHVPF